MRGRQFALWLTLGGAFLASMVTAAIFSSLTAEPSAPRPAALAPDNRTSDPARPGSALNNTRSQGEIRDLLDRLPLSFIENQGQLDSRVKYYLKGRGQAIYCTRGGIHLVLRKPSPQPGSGANAPPRRSILHMKKLAKIPVTGITLAPVGLSPDVEICAAGQQRAKVSYFQGRDPRQWRTGIPTYGAVVYRRAYPGIDLKFYGAGGHLEYDIIAHPGADPTRVKFHCQGAKSLKVTPNGDLAITLADGRALLQQKPQIYQEIKGIRVAREGHYRLTSGMPAGAYGFDVAAYDRKAPLVIDPVLSLSSYLGGDDYDTGAAICIDSVGDVAVAGTTFSDNSNVYNQVVSGYSIPPQGVNGAAVVWWIDPDGSCGGISYLAGGPGESVEAYGIAIGPVYTWRTDLRAIFLTGITDANSFPLLNPFQAAKQGAISAFVTKIAAGELDYSSYLGGDYEDEAYGLSLDQNNNVYVTGKTFNPATQYDAFVAKIKDDGNWGYSPTLIYRNIIGGSGNEAGNGIACDQNGNAYVVGETDSANFPTTAGAFQTTGAGGYHAFVSKLDSNGNPIYTTLLGGSSGQDKGYAIAVDGSGQAHVTGITYSTDFPVKGAFQAGKNGSFSAFVTKLNAAGSGLVYSSYLGRGYGDAGYGLALDQQGMAYVTGETDLPVPDSNPQTYQADAFVARITANGSALNSYLHFGGSDDDWGNAIVLDQAGYAYVTGETWSSDFPIKLGEAGWTIDSQLGGPADAFVSRINISAAPIGPILNLLLQ